MKPQTATPRTSFALVVVLKDDGNFVGNIGAEIDYEESKTELWYSMAPELHGKSYATKAVWALLPLLPTSDIVEIECGPRNTPSRKLAERLGFKKIRYDEKAFECKGEWWGLVTYTQDRKAPGSLSSI